MNIIYTQAHCYHQLPNNQTHYVQFYRLHIDSLSLSLV